MLQDKTGSGQQTKPSDGATVEANSHSEVVTDETEVTKETDEVVKNKPLSLKDKDRQSDSAAAERDVTKESDELVKSKPLSLRVGDSQGRQPDSAAASGEISKETVQNSGTTLTTDSAITILKQEPKDADSKHASTTSASRVSTTPNIELKIETALSQDIEYHKTATAKPAVSANERHTTHSSTTGIAEGEACGTISSQDGSSQTIESGREQERNVTVLSQVQIVEAAVQDVAAVEVLPSAPALIDFSDEAQQSSQQVVNVQTVASTVTTTTVASMGAEGTEDASKILYPRLDSIMQGTQVMLLYRARCNQWRCFHFRGMYICISSQLSTCTCTWYTVHASSEIIPNNRAVCI